MERGFKTGGDKEKFLWGAMCWPWFGRIGCA